MIIKGSAKDIKALGILTLGPLIVLMILVNFKVYLLSTKTGISIETAAAWSITLISSLLINRMKPVHQFLMISPSDEKALFSYLIKSYYSVLPIFFFSIVLSYFRHLFLGISSGDWLIVGGMYGNFFFYFFAIAPAIRAVFKFSRQSA
jgi:hypothetical protein